MSVPFKLTGPRFRFLEEASRGRVEVSPDNSSVLRMADRLMYHGLVRLHPHGGFVTTLEGRILVNQTREESQREAAAPNQATIFNGNKRCQFRVVDPVTGLRRQCRCASERGAPICTGHGL